MKNFKRIAIASEEKIVQTTALTLLEGCAGSISTALAELPRAKAQALVEAMPESKIAERLLAIIERIEIGGTFANPEISLIDKSEGTEELHERLTSDIEAIISLASDEKFSRVLHHLIQMYIDLVDDVSSTSLIIDPKIKNGHIKSITKGTADRTLPYLPIRSHLHTLDVESEDYKKLPVLVVNDSTYRLYETIARTEIINDEATDFLIGHARHLIDFIKFLMLEKVLIVVFDAIKSTKRFEDVQRALSVGLRIKLEGSRLVALVDPDTQRVVETIISAGPSSEDLETGNSLITEQELAANPDAVREVARIVREEEEMAVIRAEVKAREKIPTRIKTDPVAQAFLAQHAGALTEFDEIDRSIEQGDPDTVSLEEVDESGRKIRPKKVKVPQKPKGLEFDE